MATRWMTIGSPARGEVHQRVDVQKGSGSLTGCVVVDAVFVTGW